MTGAATGGGTTLTNGTTTNAYDANDRITAQSGPGGMVNHSYDADGNETTVNGQLAAYDFENHLVGLGSGATSYVYDADGNRVSVTSGGVATGYVVDTSLPYASVVEEYSGTTLANGTLAARYDYGDDLIRMDRGPVGSQVASYYLFDGLGSTRHLVSGAGAVTDTWGYSAFGEQVSRTPATGGTVNPFLFNAQQFDQPTGTYFLRARYYDQTIGRFLSQDPFGGDSEDPISLHRYLYASDDPADRIDPGGDVDFSLSGISSTLTGVANFTAQNYTTVIGAGLFVYGVFDPNGAISLGETLPQAEGGAELGAASSRVFSRSGQAIAGYLERIGDWRKFPGVAQGGEKLQQITGEWFRGSDGNVGSFPKQIADGLRGTQFSTFDKFREAFWKEVANDPDLSKNFKPSNLTRMLQGKAPFVRKSQAIGKARTYVLHHVTPINQGGSVYSMDNLRIVTPRYHKEILDPDYHYGI